jgi:signal transduction histidine kinase
MRERAEMVGGTFQIESVEGKGTAIQVEIPRARVPDESRKSKRRLLKTPSKIS